MSSKSQRKKEFLKQHPFCCFCGGKTKSEEPDHMPSRVFFDNKQWPEGYEFPSCVSCNRRTRHDEQVVAMLSRMFPDPTTLGGKKEARERVRAVAHNYPKLFEEMQSSIRQVRTAVKKYGLEKPKGTSFAEMPLLNVSGPLVNEAVDNFSRKLSLALHYFHTGNIIPHGGGIAVRWFTNLQIDNDSIPKELAGLLCQFPRLERSRMDLADQFFYRYVVADDEKISVFLSFFRRSFAILGYVAMDSSLIELPAEVSIYGPFDNS